VRITVSVKPGSTKGPLVEESIDGAFTVFLKQRAVDGAANTALIEVLAKHFKVKKAAVEIESGFTSRHKRVRIDI
jgi:uncharacterized protein (TIGR00251 family)